MIDVIATLLPLEAREMLVRASQVEPHIPPGDSVRRAYVIDSVVRELRVMYPQFWQAEE